MGNDSLASNLRNVAIGTATDVSLTTGDIVFVPKSALGKIDEVTRQILPLLQSASYTKNITD